MLHKDFREFAESLNAAAVEYLLVGGYALAAHGHPRYTGDIDFWVRPTEDNIARLLRALEAFGFASLKLAAADFGPDTVVQLGHPPWRIDLLTGLDGVAFEDCWTRRDTVQLDGVSLPVIGLKDLKVNKRATGRAKDLADLESIEGGER